MRLVGEDDIETLVDQVRHSTLSDFYAQRWGSEHEFSRLPSVSREDFLVTPLSRRRYKESQALVKLVRARQGLFASEWAFDDIALESLGPIGERPLVYLVDPDEAVEKSMWCYEQNRVPLIGERMPEVVHSAAAFYNIDSVICDIASLPNLLPYLQTRAQPLAHVSILGTAFDAHVLHEYRSFVREIRLILTLPETGAFASTPLENYPNFSIHGDSYIEEVAEGTLLTKRTPLVTPVIRYQLPDLEGARFEP